MSSPSPTSAADPILEVHAAVKRFGDRPALSGVNLELRRGEILALLGPNGAGKTTLVRAICGRLSLDSGSVTVFGKDPARHPAARACLGLVPQEIALYMDLSVRENLSIFGRLAGVSRAGLGNAVERALRWTDLATRAHEPASSLSGGMKRRLNIAAGTLHEPALLLLDEPTVGIDPSAQEAIHELLLELRRSGMAMLLTTHDLEQAEKLADRIAIQVDGCIRAVGSRDELVREHLGNSEELTVTLASKPDASEIARLTDLGLHAVGEGSTWSGSLEDGLDSLTAVSERLSEAGVAVAEMRARRPSLRGVFFRVTGRELRT